MLEIGGLIYFIYKTHKIKSSLKQFYDILENHCLILSGTQFVENHTFRDLLKVEKNLQETLNFIMSDIWKIVFLFIYLFIYLFIQTY